MKKSLLGARIGIVLEFAAGMLILSFASLSKPIPDVTIWLFIFGLAMSVTCSILSFFEKEK